MNFAKRLKQLRKEHNLTQNELAEKISKTRSTIAGYETERKEPDYETLRIIADFFDVSIDYILGRTNERHIKYKDKDERVYSGDENLEALKFIDDFVKEMKARGYDYSDRSKEEIAELLVKILKASDILKSN